MEKGKSHFILVHGGCHGAWCWYKLATLLRSAGHQVSLPDMAAAGINLTPLEELKSVSEYSKPLMDCFETLASEEKVILVGHSFGGFSLSLAMERFPQKIAVAVFVTAFMPGPELPLATFLQQVYSRGNFTKDNTYFFADGTDNPPTSYLLGDEYLASTMYQNCPPEDLSLAKMLVRPVPLLHEFEDVVLSKEKYGSVPRVFVVSDEDNVVKKEFQEWMIKNNPTDEVKEIVGADHMTMLSKPLELSTCLQHISATYS